MARHRLVWQFLPPFMILALLSLAVLTTAALFAFQNFYYARMRAEQITRAELVREALHPHLLPAGQPGLLPVLTELARSTGLRITVVALEGEVLADSEEPLDQLNNHADRPEIIQALRGEKGYAFRYSHSVEEELIYAAVPIRNNGMVTGAMRVAMPAAEIRVPMRALYLQIIGVGLLTGLLVLVMSWVFSRRIELPLEAIRRGAERFAQGDFSERLPVPRSHEIAGVAQALNQMAEQLNERIQLIVRQRNEQEAVLASMVESVIAVDNTARIISLNRAAALLLGVEPARVQGQPLHTVVRNTALHRLIAGALEASAPTEQEVVLHTPDELVLQAHTTSLHEASGDRLGAVVVLNDITSLRRLERVRRDFVANVSHELRTPITAIKGFVETMLDDPEGDPEDARRFLLIVARQSERLNAIINDLLMLSRLEQENDTSPESMLGAGKLRPVVQAAVQTSAPAAEARQVALVNAVPDGLEALINAQLLEQCVLNLLENAVTYTEPGGTVHVDAERTADRVVLRVRDTGCGISPEHQPRIFERFYRVDKGRSRRAGGTGLGLAIVKHIAQVHGGSVRVQSQVGVGSTFSIVLRSLPAATS